MARRLEWFCPFKSGDKVRWTERESTNGFLVFDQVYTVDQVDGKKLRFHGVPVTFEYHPAQFEKV